MKTKKTKIFISPLDWGLGHTTRCIPIIKALQELNTEIWIGVNKTQQKLLSEELTNVNYIHFNGYNISYPASEAMTLKMALQIPKILTKINTENKELKKLNEKYKFDLVLSDNRFGLHSNDIPSIYITHQINIQAPLGGGKILHKLHQKYISKFNQCWIPDDNLNTLAGRLSKSNRENHHYIGLLSRFSSPAFSLKSEYKYLAIISGPEPQRSIFENKIINSFKTANERCAILGGKPLSKNQLKLDNIDYFSHLPSSLFLDLVNLSEKIICRPGYSSIMDFATLQKPVFFIPTPGQTEQEYLAKYFKQNYNIGYCKQSEIEGRIVNTQFNNLPYQINNSLKETLRKHINSLGFSL